MIHHWYRCIKALPSGWNKPHRALLHIIYDHVVILFFSSTETILFLLAGSFSKLEVRQMYLRCQAKLSLIKIFRKALKGPLQFPSTRGQCMLVGRGIQHPAWGQTAASLHLCNTELCECLSLAKLMCFSIHHDGAWEQRPSFLHLLTV